MPFAPQAPIEPLTSTVGCLSRSVRDTARWLDVAGGPHPRDPFSLPPLGPFEQGLLTRDLAGLRVAVLPTFGGAVVHPEVVAVLEEAAAALVSGLGLRRVEVPFALPDPGAAWVTPALPVLWAGLGPSWPGVRELVTDEVAATVDLAAGLGIDAVAAVDPVRRLLNEAVADLFEQVDLVLGATNPDVAHPAAGPSPTQVASVEVDAYNTGRLTMPMNIAGLPAVSVPAGLSSGGLPVGMQVVGMRHSDALLLDVAARFERLRPWPLLAPGRGPASHLAQRLRVEAVPVRLMPPPLVPAPESPRPREINRG